MQNEWYFYLDEGEAKGPLELPDVVEKINQGDLGALDLVFNEKEGLWKSAVEFKELKDFFGQVDWVTEELRPWVLLKKKQGDLRFVQKGPYSTKSLEKMVIEGEVSSRDYLWDEEGKKWQSIHQFTNFKEICARTTGYFLQETERISTPEDFLLQMKNLSQKSEQKPAPLFELKQVKKEEPKAEPPPPEADPEDLVALAMQPPVEQAVEDNSREPGEFEAKPLPIVKNDDGSESLLKKVIYSDEATEELEPSFDKNFENVPDGDNQKLSLKLIAMTWLLRKKPEQLFLIFTTVLVVFLALLFFPNIKQGLNGNESENMGVEQKVEPESSPQPTPVEVVTPKTAKKLKPVESEKVEPPLLPTPAVRKLPEKLLVNLSRNGPLSQKIQVRSDGSRHYPIFLSFYSDIGSNAEPQSQFRGLKREWNESLLEFEIGELKLPPGLYKVRVDHADLSEVKNFKWGVFSDSTKEFLKIKKQAAPQFNRERKRFVRVAEQYISLTQQLLKNPTGNPSSNKDWEKWSNWQGWRNGVKNPGNTAFPFWWMQLGREVDELIRLRRDLLSRKGSTESSQEMEAALARLKELSNYMNQKSLY